MELVNPEKKKTYQKEYRQKHKEDRAKYQKEYRLKNPEKIKEYNRIAYWRHRDKNLLWAKQYQEENRDARKNYSDHYRKRNREKILIKKKNYRNGNRHTLRDYQRVYEAKRRGYLPPIPGYDEQKMLDEQANKCKICGLPGKLVLDHCHSTGIVRGMLCGRCNSGLGHFMDSESLLYQAATYLIQSKGSKK